MHFWGINNLESLPKRGRLEGAKNKKHAERRTKAALESLKEYASLLYIKEKLSQKEIAAKLNVRPNTVSKWVTDEQWDKQKKNFVLTRQEQMGNMLDELTELNEAIKLKPAGLRFADSKLSDVRSKLIKNIRDLETKTSKPEAISACIALLDFIRRVDLTTAQDFAPFIDAFLKSLYQ